MRGRRAIELRTSASFAWAPCEPVAIPNRRLWQAWCADQAARRPPRPRDRSGDGEGGGQKSPPGEEMHLKALGQLLLGAPEHVGERAITLLWAALAARPRDPALLNDQGIALALRAAANDEPSDLVLALDALSRAVDVDGHRPEALFNQALLQERLYLPMAAERAWEACLALDATSGWAREAKRHLTLLRSSGARAGESIGQGRVLRQAVIGRQAAAALAAKDRQAAREFAVEEALAEWGDDSMRGDRAGAALALQQARGIGKALIELNGDATAADAVRAIEGATGKDAVGALMEGHRSYGAARRLMRAYRVEPAVPLLELAADRLGRGASPVAVWADLGLAAAHVQLGEYRQAEARLQSLLAQTDGRRYPALVGRAYWGLGWSRGRQGQLGAAYENYQRAVPFFTAAGENLSLADIHARLAEVLNLLGQPDLGWRHRYAALRVVTGGDPNHLYYLLEDAALAAMEDGRPSAALSFQSEAVEVAHRGGDHLRLAEALVSRGRIALALERREAAAADLQQAGRASTGGASGTLRDRVEGDLAFLEGEARRISDPVAAIGLLERSIEFYRRRTLPLSLPAAYLSKARAELALDREREAEADFAAAAGLAAQQASAAGDQRFRLSFSDTVQALFDDIILHDAERSHGALAALDAAERARDLSTSAPAPGASASVQGKTAGLSAPSPAVAPWFRGVPAGVTIVEYALVHDELLSWTVQAGSVSMSRQPNAARGLEPLLRSWLGDIREAGAEKDERRLSAELYRRLIPPDLNRTETLVFIPDGVLNGVPFAALRNPATGRYLIEERAVVVAPSARLYLAAVHRPAARPVSRWKALLVGNPAFDRGQMPWLPELPGAAGEIADIARLYQGATVLTGAQPTVSRVLLELSRHELVHYAGHAVPNLRDPDASYLPLAPSPASADPGVLYAHQIERCRFPNLRMVVLSACGTIAPLARRNGGLAGLARPFLEAGAAAVLGTLWSVEDGVSAQVLVDFHRRLRDGQSASASLRGAQLSLLRGPRADLRQPGAWASFELLGDFVPEVVLSTERRAK